jgi:hypothetical protein
MKQNQTNMIQLRRSRFKGMKISRRGSHLTARMGLRHTHVPALARHLLTAFPLGCRHRRIGHHTCHDWQRDEQYRQSENSDFLHSFQRH